MTEDAEMKGSYSRRKHALNRSRKLEGERFKPC